jgi:hypothetical protein
MLIKLDNCKDPKLIPDVSRPISFKDFASASRYAQAMKIEGVYVVSNHLLYPIEREEEKPTVARQWISLDK